MEATAIPVLVGEKIFSFSVHFPFLIYNIRYDLVTGFGSWVGDTIYGM